MRKEVTIERINISKPKESKLTAIMFVAPYIDKNGKRDRAVLCKCLCGKEKIYRARLVMYKTLSCGCLSSPKYPRSLQKTYYGMINRCYSGNKFSVSYKKYEQKGVTVCDEWIKDKNLFCEWALNNGYEAGLQLDKDIRGNGLLYSPDTCCFVTAKENNRARKCLKRYVFDGKEMILSEIAELTGTNVKLLSQSMHRQGKTIEEAVDTPFFNGIKKKLREILSNIPQMETEQYSLKVKRAQVIIKEILSL